MVGVGAFISLHCFDSVDWSTEWHLACQATCSRCLRGTLTKWKRRPIKRKVKVMVFLLLGSGSLVTVRMLWSCQWKNWMVSTSRSPLCLVVLVNSRLCLWVHCVVYILRDYGTAFCILLIQSTLLASESWLKGTGIFQEASGGQRNDEARPLVVISGLSFLQCFKTVSWVTGWASSLQWSYATYCKGSILEEVEKENLGGWLTQFTW